MGRFPFLFFLPGFGPSREFFPPSPGKKPHPKPQHHPVARPPPPRHYTRKAQSHLVVRHHYVRHYTLKAHEDKAARHLHKAHKHKKTGQS